LKSKWSVGSASSKAAQVEKIKRFEMAWADYVIAEIDSSEQKQQSKWICSNHVEAYMVQP
jgi:hypothetical protein